MSENTEMIERVARAMCRANITKPALVMYSPEGVEYHVNERWREWEFEVRAAIDAMREPTETMIDAAYSDEMGYWSDGPDVAKCYTAMIEAALMDKALEGKK